MIEMEKVKVKGFFPAKLYEALDLAEALGLDCVGWLPHGRAFKVFDEDTFMKTVVPRFFNQTRIRSFKRQLHKYGFQILSLGPDAGAYYHECFLRGCRDEMKKMVRVTVNKDARAMIEPDFYRMPPLVRRDESSTDEVGPPTSIVSSKSRHTPSPLLSNASWQFHPTFCSSGVSNECGPSRATAMTPVSSSVGSVDAASMFDDFCNFHPKPTHQPEADVSSLAYEPIRLSEATEPLDGTLHEDLALHLIWALFSA